MLREVRPPYTEDTAPREPLGFVGVLIWGACIALCIAFYVWVLPIAWSGLGQGLVWLDNQVVALLSGTAGGR